MDGGGERRVILATTDTRRSNRKLHRPPLKPWGLVPALHGQRWAVTGVWDEVTMIRRSRTDTDRGWQLKQKDYISSDFHLTLGTSGLDDNTAMGFQLFPRTNCFVPFGNDKEKRSNER